MKTVNVHQKSISLFPSFCSPSYQNVADGDSSLSHPDPFLFLANATETPIPFIV